MSLPVDRADGNEEAVPGMEAKGLGRDHLIFGVVGNGDALPIEVLVHGTSSDDEVNPADKQTGWHQGIAVPAA